MPRIVRFHQTGKADVLKIEQLPEQIPGEGEIRLKVETIGLNRAEVMFRQGMYFENPEPPSRIGYEAFGEVDAVGPGVTDFQVGDRVSSIPGFSMRKYGVYGESAVVPAQAAAHVPDSLSAVEAAAIWMQYLTAYGALIEFGRLAKGQAALITAASSSVGLAAIQTARAIGAKALATTRTSAKKDFLLEAGADQVIVTDEQNLAARTMELTDGRGADLVFDPVAGPFLQDLAQAAAPGATIFEYGALSSEQTVYPLIQAMAKGLNIRGYLLFEITGHPERLARGKKFVYEHLASGALKPIIARTFALDAIVEAHQYMESNQQKGKIVVTV